MVLCLLCVMAGLCRRTPVVHAAGGITLRKAAALAAPPRLFVLSIGINHPAGKMFGSSSFAEDDATAIADTLSTTNKGLAMQVFTRRLLGAEATQAGIRDAMHDIAKTALPSDVFLFFMASTSGIADGQYIFPAADTSSVEGEPGERAMRGGDLAAMLLGIPALRQIVVLDGCDSQLASDSIRDALQPKGAFQLGALQREVAIFANRGTAFEVPSIKHGVMTYALLQGLQGAADVDHSGVITEARLEGYMAWKVPEMSKQLGMSDDNQQHFYSYSTFNNLVFIRPPPPPEPKPQPAVVALDGPTRAPGARPQTPPKPADLGKDYALILATDHHSDGIDNLSNPVYDAKALRDELIADYGYAPERITELYDARKSQFQDAVVKLGQSKDFGPSDRLLVYIAGHGTRNSIDGYLVFADSASPERDPTQNTLLGFGTLRTALDVIPVDHILLVMDVCYGGTFDGLTATHTKTRFQGIPAGVGDNPQTRLLAVERMMSVQSRIYITSTDEDHLAFDGNKDKHSPFANALLAKLKLRGGDDHLVDIGSIYSSLHLTLPVDPRAGYFDNGGAETNATFVLIPSDAMAFGHGH